MISKKTCLVLGAGASRPYMLPTSRDLRHIILGSRWGKDAFDRLGWDAGLITAQRYDNLLLQAGFEEKKLSVFRGEFFNAQRVSIDAFLAERKEEFETIGKFAIALAVLLCERRYSLNENWYQWLLEELIQDGRDFDASNLKVVTFNYDRSFEVYFWRAFRATFKLSDDQADEMLSRIEIVHVYGHCGEFRRGVEVVPYGGDDGSIEQAARAAKTINVVAPRTLPPTTERVRQIIDESERVCFLGFGFWKENFDLLELCPDGKEVFASCRNLPQTTKGRINEKFAARGRAHGYAYPREIPRIQFGDSAQDVS